MITGIVKNKELTPLTNIVSSEAVINLIYPVGSIYTSLDATFNPNTTWTGTTWELQKEGIFIEATQQDAKVGVETKAGAPNITGMTSNYFFGTPGKNGAITTVSTNNNALATNGGPAKYVNTSFNASDSNPIYGRSNTIQPYSVKAKVWKRTA